MDFLGLFEFLLMSLGFRVFFGAMEVGFELCCWDFFLEFGGF